MALDPIGNSLKLDELKRKLKERFPEHNFDIPPEPDRRCKAPSMCKSNKIFYTDSEGNKYCGQKFKLQHDDNPYSWEWATCHALVSSADEQGKFKEMQTKVF
jgi:hypothetical protein